MAAASTTTLSMKLLVDTKAARVLYAEASKDVVDFLFSLLTLPVGTVVKILGNDAMVGSIGNLYGSVEKLDETYVRSADAKGALLAPAGGYESGKLLQLPEAAQPTEFYRCTNNNYTECQTNLSKVSGIRCLSVQCGYTMTRRMSILAVDSNSGSGGVAAAAAQPGHAAGKGFVQGVVTYTVMDDLKVAPMSTISGITLLNTFGITDVGTLEEKTVKLGYEEGLKILKASLQSKKVLTDVFLAFAPPSAATPTIKLLIAKEAQVVVLAEAGKDMVDFLLGLLAMPVGAVVKLLGNNKDNDGALAGLASLYASVQQMDAGYMQSLETRDALLNPAPAHPALVAAAGGFPSLVQPAAPAPPSAPGKASASGGMSLKSLSLPAFGIGSAGACHCAACLAAQEQGSKGFVRGAVTYTVMDDLSVTPMSNISSIALLHRLGVEDLGALEEKTVKIGYQEGLEILKASLHSKTVLTDVFLVLAAKKKRARTEKNPTNQQLEKRARGDPSPSAPAEKDLTIVE